MRNLVCHTGVNSVPIRLEKSSELVVLPDYQGIGISTFIQRVFENQYQAGDREPDDHDTCLGKGFD